MDSHAVTSDNQEEATLAVVSQIHDIVESGRVAYVKVYDRRSLDANAQVWVWSQQIAKFEGWTIPETGKELKLKHGLPIILADPEYGKKTAFVLKRCGFDSMLLEQKLEMIDYLPITRLFSTKQHNSYRDSIQVHYAQRGLNLEYQNA